MKNWNYGRFSLRTEEAELIAEEVLNYVKSCGQFWEIWDEMLPQTQQAMKAEIAKIIKKRHNQFLRKSYAERGLKQAN